MVSDLFFYQLVLLGVVWLCLLLYWVWPSDCATVPPTASRRRRRREPTPFAGLTTKPPRDACLHPLIPHPQAPPLPPPRLVMTRGPRRQIDTSSHFCPNP